ncbi:unnamed protein product [Coregonus sp. 'balchen']|nr:unnamed protein product [Coregonus sp. 'balchen']
MTCDKENVVIPCGLDHRLPQGVLAVQHDPEREREREPCKTCLEELWKCKDDQECPVCMKISSMPFPAVSLTLKRLCEGFLQHRSYMDAVRSERFCTLHKEKLKLFCLEDQQPVCLDHKERVKAELEPLKKKLSLFSEAKLACDQTAEAVEECLKGDHITFLQRYKATLYKARSQSPLPGPQLNSGALIDMVNHLCNLQFSVWEKLQEIVKYYPVTLDPNTANPDLLMYHDLARFRLRDSLPFEGDEMISPPDNPERINLYKGVLGSEGFDTQLGGGG